MLTLNINKEETRTSSQDTIFDVAIIGSGPAGMTAAIYSSRALLKTIVIEKLGAGGQAAVTDIIENYPGFPDGINGFELTRRMEEQARKFGAFFENAEVRDVVKDSHLNAFIIKAGTAEFKSKSVIIATGTSPKRLGVKGESTYIGQGLSTCATCDGPLYRDKIVAVVGGGDSALDEGLFLTRFAKKVYVIHRRNEFRAVKILQKRAKENAKMEFLCERIVEEIIGDEKIRRVRLKNVKTGEESELEIDGLFLYIGLNPNTQMVNVKKDESGYIITDETMQTNVKGIFAAGDCRKTSLRQVATAIGDGAIAAHFAEKYVEELNMKDGKIFDGIPCSLK